MITEELVVEIKTYLQARQDILRKATLDDKVALAYVMSEELGIGDTVAALVLVAFFVGASN